MAGIKVDDMSKTNNEQLIAYCGLCCFDCHGYQQKIPDLARDLRAELRSSRYEKFASYLSTVPFGRGFRHYKECYEVLGSMVRFRCPKGCRKGGGNPFCAIRKCSVKKKLDGCWECALFEKCEKLDFLKHVHDNGHIKNLNILKKKGKSVFLNGKRHW